MEDISRRGFLAGSAAVVGAASVGPLAGFSQLPSSIAAVPAKELAWDVETDVVVVGFGGAGATAAMGASDAGASVILLEKAPEQDAGGNTSVAGGGGLYPSDESKVREAFEFLRMQMPEIVIDDEEIEGFVEELLTQVEWLEDHDAEVNTFVGSPGGALYAHHSAAAGLDRTFRIGSNGASLFAFLKEATENSAGVDIRYQTPAKKLVFDPDTKEVYGVIAQDQGGEIKIKAKRGVVLACGGFENDPYMKNIFYPPKVPIYPCGTPYNTGDGLRMITELGAKLRGFSSIEWGCHNCRPASEEIGVHVGFSWTTLDPWENAILVNDQGKRFVNETQPVVESTPNILRPLHEKSQIPELAFNLNTLRYTNLPMYLIFGETHVQAGPLFNAASENASNHWAHLKDWYTWSDDNQAEISKGWITKADTLEELASKLGIDSAGLAATVAAYDAGCAAGNDSEMGRKEKLSPIGEGPYYGCEMGLGIINTQGGPARDAAHRVLSWDDKPIPRLYSAGEFGSIYVFLYQGAGNISETIGGRVAGANAATETPWDA